MASSSLEEFIGRIASVFILETFRQVSVIGAQQVERNGDGEEQQDEREEQQDEREEQQDEREERQNKSDPCCPGGNVDIHNDNILSSEVDNVLSVSATPDIVTDSQKDILAYHRDNVPSFSMTSDIVTGNSFHNQSQLNNNDDDVQVYTIVEDELNVVPNSTIINNETINILANSKIPSQYFKAQLQIPIVNAKLNLDWKNVPIVDKKGYRSFTDLTFLKNVLSKHNKFCNFKFTKNRVSKPDSRKKKTPYANCHAECIRKECPVKVGLKVFSYDASSVNLIFSGDVCHNIHNIKADRITGDIRKNLINEFESNMHTPPSQVVREKMADIDPDTYAAGNRLLASSPGVLQKVKSAATKSNAAKVTNTIEEVALKLIKEDENLAKSAGIPRKLFGFVHEYASHPVLRLVLTHESTIKLFHFLCQQDILYFDASGSFIEKMDQYKRILLYTFSVRHPFGKSPPLPIAEYLTSSHTIPSIRSFIARLRELECSISNGKKSSPRLIMMDHSTVLMSACTLEFCGEDLTDYFTRTLRIVSGEASEEDLCKSIVHICFAHMMKLAAKDLKSDLLGKSKKNKVARKRFGMMYFARLTECTTIAELKALILLGAKVMTSRYNSREVEESLAKLEESIRTFPQVECLTGVEDDMNDEDEDDELCSIDNSQAGEEQSSLNVSSSLSKYWTSTKDGIIKQLEENQIHTDDVDDVNIHYLPNFMKSIVQKRLAYCTAWSAMCLGNIQRFNMNYPPPDKFALGAKNIYVDNSTNAISENLFSTIKRNTENLRVSIPRFLQTAWLERSGIRRQFVDGLIGKEGEECALEESQLEKLQKALNAKGKSKPYVAQEEKWSRSEKRRATIGENGLGTYRPVNNSDVTFSTPTIQPQDKDCQAKVQQQTVHLEHQAFNMFQNDKWDAVAANSPTPTDCKRTIISSWKALTNNLKQEYISEASHRVEEHLCICEGDGEYSNKEDTQWVCCDCCDRWLHMKCIGLEKEMASNSSFFVCMNCIQSRVVPFVRYLSTQTQKALDSHLQMTELNHEWQKFDRSTQLAIGMQSITTERWPIQPIEITSRNGVENIGTICWFIAVVQVVCGTTLSDIFPKETSSDEITACLIALFEDLKVKSVHNWIRVNEVMTKLSEIGGFELKKNAQMWDAAEFYQMLIQRINEVSQSMEFKQRAMFHQAFIVMCKGCGELSGTVDCMSILRIAVVTCTSPVSLKSLIWDTCMCQSTFHGRGLVCVCDASKQTKKKKNSFLDVSPLLESPEILPILTERFPKENSTRSCKTHIDVPLEMTLDVSIDKSSTYELFAAIIHTGESLLTGHYVTYLISDNSIYEFNDKEVKSKGSVTRTVNSGFFSKATRLLFYRRKDRPSDSQPHEWFPTIENRQLLESVWHNKINVPEKAGVTVTDLHSLCTNTWIEGDVINAYLYHLSVKTSIPIKVLDSTVYTSLAKGRNLVAFQEIIAAKEELCSANLILLPIHQNGVHWSLLAILPQVKAMIHMDSCQSNDSTIYSTMLSLMMHISEGDPSCWTFVSPLVAQQRNGVDCGVYVCVNAHSLTNGQTPLSEEEFPDTLNARYRIGHDVLHGEFAKGRKRHGQNKTTKKIPVHSDIVKESQIVNDLSLLYKQADVSCFAHLLAYTGNETTECERGGTVLLEDEGHDLLTNLNALDEKVLLDLEEYNQVQPNTTKHNAKLEMSKGQDAQKTMKTKRVNSVECEGEVEGYDLLRSFDASDKQVVSDLKVLQKENKCKRKMETMEGQDTRKNIKTERYKDIKFDVPSSPNNADNHMNVCSDSEHNEDIDADKVHTIVNSFKRNTHLLINKLKDANGSVTVETERCSAGYHIPREDFLSLSSIERTRFDMKFGVAMMKQLFQELKSVLVKPRRERLVNVHQPKGNQELPLPAVGSLHRNEVVEFVILPESLIRFLMEQECSTYAMASKQIYRMDKLTIFHVSNYMWREVFMKNI